MRRPRGQRFDFFIEEMLSSMRRVLEYTRNLKDYQEFSHNTLVKDAVIRNFEIMGESVKHIPFNFQKKNKHVPWSHMLALRNFIVHEFFDIDDEILWQIIKTDLEKNILALEQIVIAARKIWK
jgi:uncharacterized protein with HEPN domain